MYINVAWTAKLLNWKRLVSISSNFLLIFAIIVEWSAYFVCWWHLHVADPLVKYLPEPKLIHDVPFQYSVWGLAILNDELFVITIYTSTVYIFDFNTLERFALLFNPFLDIYSAFVIATAIFCCIFATHVFSRKLLHVWLESFSFARILLVCKWWVLKIKYSFISKWCYEGKWCVITEEQILHAGFGHLVR